MSIDLSGFSVTQLLGLYSDVIEALRAREVTRSSNNPVADYTEHLVCRALGLTRTGNSTSGHDAVDERGQRFQIKARRPHPRNRSTQLSAIRNLAQRPFDFLVAVIYRPNFSVDYAGIVPYEVVVELARFTAHTNSHRFIMRRSVLDDPRVVDITSKLVA